MKRRDYLLIANAIAKLQQEKREVWDTHDYWVLNKTSEALADALQDDNPNGFDRELFLQNAGLQQ